MIDLPSDITSGSTRCWRFHYHLPCHSPTLATAGKNVHLGLYKFRSTNNPKMNSPVQQPNLVLTNQHSSPPMLLLLSLHSSSNPSLHLQSVQQQGRRSRPGFVPKRLRPLPLAAWWDSNPPGPTHWDPNSQQPGFPLNLLPGVEADSTFLAQPTFNFHLLSMPRIIVTNKHH